MTQHKQKSTNTFGGKQSNIVGYIFFASGILAKV
jgi:hypothetical protein